jgi:DNA (cytosine-5)-methyltransferase 1
VKQLVLSLFPGADLFGMAFEQEGFVVVRGPDILLGGDVRKFKSLPGKFDGIIGGPPCKVFSEARMGGTPALNLIPEFTRIILESSPKWWVMENVVGAHIPEIPGCLEPCVVDAWTFGSNQHRVRAFWSNIKLELVKCVDRAPNPWPTIMATEYKCSPNSKNKCRAGRKVGRRLTIEEVNEAMGLPINFSTPALTLPMSYEVRGNGVPIHLGRAIAKAVRNYHERNDCEGGG